MSGFPTKHERIKIIQASDSELAEESPVRIEFYRRYWAVESWDPVKSKIHWVEASGSIVASLGTTHGKVTTVVKNHPVRVEPLACPGCAGPVYINTRQMVQQALRGSVPACTACVVAMSEESRRARLEREQQLKVRERKNRKAFNATICDDRHPEECVGFLSESAVKLYLDMLAQYQDYRPVSPGESVPEVLLCGPWAMHHGDKYKKAGPDLYALASHRLIKPVSDLTRAIELTRHGLVNPSGYPYVSWAVEEELDGWPVVDLMGKRLRLLENQQDPDSNGQAIFS